MNPSYSSTFSSSSSSTSSSGKQGEAKRTKTLSSLHSIRKPLAKPWQKPPSAPAPPRPPRVYRVDSSNFRQLVQKLTGAPMLQSPRRLQNVAPPPLNLLAPPPPSNGDVSAPPPLQFFNTQERFSSGCVYDSMVYEAPQETKAMNFSDGYHSTNLFTLGLSPSSYTWCSFPLLSPGTLASLEQSTV